MAPPPPQTHKVGTKAGTLATWAELSPLVAERVTSGIRHAEPLPGERPGGAGGECGGAAAGLGLRGGAEWPGRWERRGGWARAPRPGGSGRRCAAGPGDALRGTRITSRGARQEVTCRGEFESLGGGGPRPVPSSVFARSPDLNPALAAGIWPFLPPVER